MGPDVLLSDWSTGPDRSHWRGGLRWEGEKKEDDSQQERGKGISSPITNSRVGGTQGGEILRQILYGAGIFRGRKGEEDRMGVDRLGSGNSAASRIIVKLFHGL